MRVNTWFLEIGVLVFALLGIAAPAQQQTTPSQKPLVLRGGLLIDGTGRAAIPDSVVVIAAGKIQSVGARGSVNVPADATLIDATGKTIIPGLADTHIHFRSFLAPFFLYWGVTTVGDMGNTVGWIMAEKQAIEKGRIQGPFIMAVGHLVNTPTPPGLPINAGERNGYNPDQWLSGNETWAYVEDEATLDAEIGYLKKSGADGVKLYTWLTPELLKKGVEVTHRYGLPAFSHSTYADMRQGIFLGLDEILDTGLDVEAHLYGLIKATVPPDVGAKIEKGEIQRPWETMDVSKFPPLVQKMVQNKMALNPTLGAQFAGGSSHRAEFEQVQRDFLEGPMAKVLPKESLPTFQRAYRAAPGQAAGVAEEGFRRASLFVKEFADAGGKIIAGTDAGPGGNLAGLMTHFEMQMLVEAGLSPMQAIQAASSWGLEAWGKGKEAGTIEAGKRADLVVLNRNPLEDITATRDINLVIQAGKVIDRAALANWREILPRPVPQQTGPANTLIHSPFINEISPESFTHLSSASEVAIRGENFTPECLVLFNDQLFPVKFQDEHRISVSIRSDTANQLGTYPLVVVRPGSGGGVSNANYIVVTGE